MEIAELVDFLRNYDGKPIRLMEVCGSHTHAIAKHGIRGLLSDKIELLSGPGCPVCVTPTAYIDKLIELSLQENTTVVTFGDLLRVPGSEESLNAAKGRGGSVEMVYSPMDVLQLAKDNPYRIYVFAAVGFETTAPVYTLLLDQAVEQGLYNIRLLTALKTMPGAISYLCDNGARIDGFIAPGHVSAVTGADYFNDLAKKYQIPFAVSGFGAKELVVAIYGLVQMVINGDSSVKNFYTSVVEQDKNPVIEMQINKYFEAADVAWRGMGIIPGSGLLLKDDYKQFDAGSMGLDVDNKKNKACRCGEILMGKAKPSDCPLFGTACTPSNPAGACMVSEEGACNSVYLSKN
ncbi:hydrogenase expression/formation protein HypD [Pseudobutyrivibrio sp. YE44]|uniref:hydrogenase formation protein HypD n=1 Tax=Pseudobutyrivibrio sp. YE44 TaxID=1520802 RepID=UPI000890E2AF|nr:hydrogenase formation protein HypD [Pseudobutyrivibrio sp. YE44]SDB49615.1 hydrogenase expression/formation protein HypD [Pseudobutyrivibrio sp. YE44]